MLRRLEIHGVILRRRADKAAPGPYRDGQVISTRRLSLLATLLWGFAASAQTKPFAEGDDLPDAGARRALFSEDESGSITAAEVVRVAAAHNPDLKAAVHDLRSAQQAFLAEQARYLPVLQLDATASRQKTPNLTVLGGVGLASGESASTGVQLSHVFPWGTSSSLRLEGTANRQNLFLNFASTDQLSLGPGYGLNARLTLQQPLLRGFGLGIGESLLRQARYGRTAASYSRDVAASALLRDVLLAYWELRYDSRAVDISRAALALAERRRSEVLARIAEGGLPEAEALQFESRVLELQQALAASVLSRRQQALTLASLLGAEALDAGLRAGSALPVPEPPLDRAEAIARALHNAPELGQLQAQLAQAREKARAAGEDARPRLDLEASVQASGLGNRALSPALSQLTGLGAVTVQVGVVYEMPVSDDQRTALRLAAQHTASALQERMRSQSLAIEATVRSQLEAERTARQNVVLSEQAVAVAEQQVAAEQQRYDAGSVIALQVHEAEDTLRQAQLARQRAKVDRLAAQLRLRHLTGDLLAAHASLLPD